MLSVLGSCLRSPVARWGAALVVLAATVLSGSPVGADPAGPTDYRTEIVGVEPPVDGVTIDVIGGDSFLQMAVAPGLEVMVVGYRGEPYLWFGPDGIVQQNERSPSRWLNDDRYGETAIPSTAGAELDPDWRVVTDAGSYAWHDHRAHWMNPQKPPGAEPGDTILEAVVPMLVDGQEVDVHVRSMLLPPPGRLAGLAGLTLGLAIAAAGIALGIDRTRSDRTFGLPSMARQLDLVPLSVAVGVVALTAFGLGWWAASSVPSETGPSSLLWLLPGVAVLVIVAGVALTLGGRIATPLVRLVAAGVPVLAGIELVVWAWLRRQALFRAVIPTDAPPVLDRLVIAATAGLGVVTVVVAVAAMLFGRIGATEPRPEPRH